MKHWLSIGIYLFLITLLKGGCTTLKRTPISTNQATQPTASVAEPPESTSPTGGSISPASIPTKLPKISSPAQIPSLRSQRQQPIASKTDAPNVTNSSKSALISPKKPDFEQSIRPETVPVDPEVAFSDADPVPLPIATSSELPEGPSTQLPAERSSDPLVSIEGNPRSRQDRDLTGQTRESLYPMQALAPMNQVSSTSSTGSGRCDYPSDYDSAGNRCGERAAITQPNLSPVQPIYSYSPPKFDARFSSPYKKIRIPEVPAASTRLNLGRVKSIYASPTKIYSGVGSTYVNGYFRKNGTYVRGHHRRSRR
jgi:hypothetical protein